MPVTLLTKDGEWNSKTAVLFCFFDPYSVNLVLAQILNEADRRGLQARLSWSHSHYREKVQFFETRLRIIFLALAWRDEIEIII